MKVIDFEKEGFEQFLKGTIKEFFTGQQKILVLGIAEGGIPVADIIFEILNKKTQNIVEKDFIISQRPMTPKKKKSKFRIKILENIFSILPKVVLNYLRIYEHKKLSKRKKNDLVRKIEHNSETKFQSYDMILVVDDAVDSGASMKAVVNFLKQHVDGSKIKTIAVVVTQPGPIFMPDHFLFRDILMRFPWSLDGK